MFTFNELAGRQPAGVKKTAGTISGRFSIKKADEEGQQTEDWSGDQLEPAELEQAAYGFVELYREGGEMHERGGCAVLVESMVVTTEKRQALGIPDGTLPVGWWIGFKVTDEDVWAKVKDGTYPMFSIEGSAIREEIPEEPEA